MGSAATTSNAGDTQASDEAAESLGALETDDVDAPGPDVPKPDDDGGAQRDLRRTRLLLTVLVLALVAVAILAWRVRAADEATADRARVQEVARTVAEQMVTLTAENGREHVDVMLGLATDPFRQQLTGLAAVFEEILRQGQVAADGRVDTTGIESIGDGEARVLATATTTVRNTQIPDGAPRHYRLVVGLREVDGQWLVSSVDVAR